VDLGRIGQQNMWFIHLLMETFKCGIVNCKFMEFFVTSLRLWTGFPYGSSLGPLLFITYITDLTRHINRFTNVVLFADDSRILITEKNYENLNQKIRLTLNCTSRCFKANQLVLN